MSFLQYLVSIDKDGRLQSGIIYPFMMLGAIFCAPSIIKTSAVVAFLICVTIAILALGLLVILKRTLLKGASRELLAGLGFAGLILTIPLVFVSAKLFLFR